MPPGCIRSLVIIPYISSYSVTVLSTDCAPISAVRLSLSGYIASKSQIACSRWLLSIMERITSLNAWCSKYSLLALDAIVEFGSMPSSRAYSLINRKHIPCMVEIHASSTCSACACIPARRSASRVFSLMLRAAACVNVIMSACERSLMYAWLASSEPLVSAHTMRCVSVNVLPEPAPASTNTGELSISAIRAWLSLRPIVRRMVCAVFAAWVACAAACAAGVVAACTVRFVAFILVSM